MALFLVIALVLAWPTYGLSVLAWLGWAVWTSKRQGPVPFSNERATALIETALQGDHADFARALELPLDDDVTLTDLSSGKARSEEDMAQIGSLIMGYLSRNRTEGAAFLVALRPYGSGHSGEFETPSIALKKEREKKPAGGQLRIVSFRAVEALMTNNTLRCFESVDLGRVTTTLNTISDTNLSSR